jgi:hypothetical protein
MVAALGVEGRVRYLNCVISMAVAWVGILPRQGDLYEFCLKPVNLSE